MAIGLRLWLGRLLDAGEAKTAFGRALLRERYRALQRQIPLLYAIALVNFLGLHFASGEPTVALVQPVTLLALLAVARLVHWVRLRGRALAPERILVELRRTLFLAGLLSIAFAYSAIGLYDTLPGRNQQDLVILFASMAAVGCAYGLTSFPAAARLPLLLFALPFAARLVASGNPAHAGVGISLGIITLMILRLVNLHNEGFVQLVWSRSEVETERERAQRAERTALAEKARVRQVADTDSLTGLANRRAFLAALQDRLGSAGPAPPFALALLDLDGFKPINDTFGHAAGDLLLGEVALRLRQEAGGGALVARIGGDEFALILPCANEAAALRAGERVCAALEEPYRVGGREFRISACCGLTLLAAGGDVTLALGQGDAALYSGKQAGRGRVALFTPAIAEANRRRIAIERALRHPNVAREFSLDFQPVFDLASGALRAFEALARWHHPTLGAIGPGEFIPITEQINVVEQISDGLLARACAEAAHWPAAVRLSFNLSAIQLCSASSAARLLAIAAEQGVEARRLQFEVTETAMLVDFAAARLNLERLRAAGARIVLDDFGAGFASISYLREIVFDAIKIDGSLVAGAVASAAGQRLLKGVLDLCASLRVPCVAEHIEGQEQIDLLRALKCRDGQGFALSRPLPAAEARALAAAKLVRFPAGKARGRSSRAA